MLGAHLLAAGERPAAREAFDHAALHAAAVSAGNDRLLSLGFARLCDLLEAPNDSRRPQRLAEIQSQLRLRKEGEFFASQIDTALRVFWGR